MAEIGSLIYDVTPQNFTEKVVNASQERPILVDFWASWCAPCKTLGPLLERVVVSYQGKVALARINVDENRELAAQFGVRSIPTVKIVMNGAIADEFVGVIPEQEIRSIINALEVSDIDDMLAYASDLIDQEQFDEAESIYTAILREQPDNSAAQIGLARLRIRTGDDDEARTLLSSIPEDDPRRDEAQSLLGLFEFIHVCQQHGGLKKAQDAAKKNPDDLETHYNLGCCHAANGSYRQAFEEFLFIVKKDRQFDDGKARKAMITLFNVVGQQDELTGEYRKKLAMELF